MRELISTENKTKTKQQKTLRRCIILSKSSQARKKPPAPAYWQISTKLLSYPTMVKPYTFRPRTLQHYLSIQLTEVTTKACTENGLKFVREKFYTCTNMTNAGMHTDTYTEQPSVTMQTLRPTMQAHTLLVRKHSVTVVSTR